jgi:radical SAM superfamily enzyme YgiQ (UPF0313 family)
MKVLALLLPVSRRECPPYSLAMAAALMRRAGHEVAVADMNNGSFHSSFKSRKLWKYTKYGGGVEDGSLERAALEESLARAARERPDAVVLMNGTRNYETSMRFAEAFKRSGAEAPVVHCGFTGLDSRKKTAMQDPLLKWVDYFIWGEFEGVLPELLAAVAAGTAAGLPAKLGMSGPFVDAVRGRHIGDLDALPFHDFTGLEPASYGGQDLLELQFTRSCAWSCRFCIEWLWEKPFRSMSGRRLFEEVQHQAKAHPAVRKIRFDDKTVNGDMDVFVDFCRRMAEARGPDDKIFWYGNAMLRREMTPDVIGLAARAGCVAFNYGLESGSPRVLADMDKDVSIPHAETILKESAARSIVARVNVLAGFPTETREDFLETVEFLRRNRPSIAEVNLAFPGCRIDEGSFLDLNRARYGVEGSDPLAWVASGGANTFSERVRRVRELCEACLEIDLPVAMHGRLMRNRAGLEAVMAELVGPAGAPVEV